MLNAILLFDLILYISGQTCSVSQISCESISDSNLCMQIKDSNNYQLCVWNQLKCEKTVPYNLPCSKYTNEYNCIYQTYGCRWDGTKTENYEYEIMKTNENGKCVEQKCEDSLSKNDCSSFNQISCDWQDDKCIQVTKCSDFKTVKGCRNTTFKERCVALANGNVLPISSSDVTIFDTFSCVVLECKHKEYEYECTFANGVQCIWGTNGCSVCASYLTYETCIQNKGLCMWNQNLCQNIECQQYKSPSLCVKKTEQCEWNSLKMRCQLNSTQSNNHCYSEYLDQLNLGQIFQIICMIFFIMIG